MVQRIKKWLVTFAQTTPFLLSNTVIVIPYLLFLGLNDGKSWLTILPFTLFYTLRMTGIFLIRSIRLGLGQLYTADWCFADGWCWSLCWSSRCLLFSIFLFIR